MSITGFFEFKNYKELLRQSLLARKAISPRYTFQRMAEACGVQKTYLSRALGDSKVHLGADALHAAGQYLDFSPDQRDFLILLAEEERSLHGPRKRELRQRLEDIRKKYQKSESAIGSSEVVREQASGLQDYYLDPGLQIVHMFLTIPAYRKDPERMRRELRMSKRRLGDVLNRLGKLGVIRTSSEGQITIEKPSLHLSADSPLVQPYRMLLRLKAGQRMAELPLEAFYSFSVIFSCDTVTRSAIQEDFLRFLKGVEKRVKASEPTEVHQMNFDILPWSRASDE